MIINYDTFNKNVREMRNIAEKLSFFLERSDERLAESFKSCAEYDGRSYAAFKKSRGETVFRYQERPLLVEHTKWEMPVEITVGYCVSAAAPIAPAMGDEWPFVMCCDIKGLPLLRQFFGEHQWLSTNQFLGDVEHLDDTLRVFAAARFTAREQLADQNNRWEKRAEGDFSPFPSIHKQASTAIQVNDNYCIVIEKAAYQTYNLLHVVGLRMGNPLIIPEREVVVEEHVRCVIGSLKKALVRRLEGGFTSC